MIYSPSKKINIYRLSKILQIVIIEIDATKKKKD